MGLELEGTLLGLGSVIRLEMESVTGLFVVLARGVYRPDPMGSKVEPRYLVGPHPYGQAPDQETFPVLARDIEELVFEGYRDSEDEAFLADLLDQVENGRRPKPPAVQYQEALTDVPERNETAVHAMDPFAKLRALTGHDDRRGDR